LLVKPVGTTELLQQLEALMARHHAEKLNRKPRTAAARARAESDRKSRAAS
jgi:hypothetical protein